MVARQFEVGEQVDEAREHGAVDGFLAENLGEGTFEAFVISLDRAHGVIDHDADAGVFGVCRERGPARLLRHPEDVLGKVFIAIFWIGELLGVEFLVHSGESDRDRPRATCLYSPGSIAPHILSAAAKRVRSMLIVVAFENIDVLQIYEQLMI